MRRLRDMIAPRFCFLGRVPHGAALGRSSASAAPLLLLKSRMKKHRPRPRKPKIRHKNCDQGRAFDPTPGGMFHGGRAGLAPGSFLLPPRERGEHRTAGQIEELGLSSC
jgi:hypothetical protein